MKRSMRKVSPEGDRFRAVCRLSDILPDTGVCALVDDMQVALFRIGAGDEVYAISGYDPFSKANVLSRGIVGCRNGEPKVASPIYKQTFSLRTGVCFDDPSVRLKVYETRVSAGIVEIGPEVTARSRVGNEATL